MKKVKVVLLAGLAVFIVGAAGPTERDLIIRLQGEVLVLQRQLRDLQETLDKNQAASSPSIQRIADNSETLGKTLFLLQERLNQTDTLQHNNLSGIEKRLSQLDGKLGDDARQLTGINNALKDLKLLVQRQSQPR